MKDYANYYLPLKLQIWWNYMSAWMRFCMCAHMVCQYSIPHIILLPIAPAFFIFSLANVYNTCCLGQCTIVTHVCCTIVLWGIINEGCIYKCILIIVINVICSVHVILCTGISQTIYLSKREITGIVSRRYCWHTLHAYMLCMHVYTSAWFFRGHKLMGQVCEKDGKVDKAVVHYNRYCI